MRNTSAPASNSRLMTARSDEAGPVWPRLWSAAAASWSLFSRRGRGCRAGAGRRRVELIARRQRLLRGLLGGLGELHGPGTLLAGIDFEEAGAVVAMGEAVADAADGEFPVAGAHIGPSRPFAAAIVVDGVDIIKTRDEIALEYGLPGSWRPVPPAFGGPAVGVLIADRDSDPARRVVA